MSTTEARPTTSKPSTAEVRAAAPLLGLPVLDSLPDAVARAAVNAARLVRDRAATNEKIRTIQEERLPTAREADRERFAANLAAGIDDDDAPTETIDAQQELAGLERRLAALDTAEARARADLFAAIEKAAPGWQPKLDADHAAAAEKFRAAVAVLRKEHEGLAAAAAASYWLRDDPTRGIDRIGSHRWLLGSENAARPGEPLETAVVLAALERMGTS